MLFKAFCGKNLIGTIVCAWFCCFIGISASAVMAGDLEKFRAGYDKDFDLISKKLQDASGRFTLTVKTKDSLGKAFKTNKDSGTFAISENLGICVRDVERTIGKQTKTFQAVYGQTADSFYTLTKNKGESEYSLDNFGPLPKSGEIPKSPIEFRLFCGSFWNAPYLFMSSDWRKALSNDENRTISIDNLERDGKKIVKLVIRYKANPDRTTEFELDPAVNHRILKSAIVMNGRADFQYQVEYLGDSVIPKVVTYTGPSEEMRCEFADLRFEPTPESEFQPAFFGLQNFNTKSASPWNAIWNWLLAGVVVVVLCLSIKKLMSRKIQHAT